MTPTFDRPFERISESDRRDSRVEVDASLSDARPLWVFAYGSLLWRPCYRVAEQRTCSARGFARSLCVWTLEARGSPHKPGLGLGLDPDPAGKCTGLAHRIAFEDRASALDALWEREMLTGIYRPAWIPVETREETLTALGFVVDRAHPQYSGPLEPAQQARLIAQAHGTLGPCIEYLEHTVSALRSSGVEDPELAYVLELARSVRDT